MASTRNKNTRGNYNLEMRNFVLNEQYTLYANSQYGEAYDTKMPGYGVNPGQIPGNKMSNNSTNIESFLFGINSTNLVEPAQPLYPEIKTLATADFIPQNKVIMPEPFAQEKNQRPFPSP